MNVQETIALIEALKSAGVTHFKSSDCELTLIPGSVSLPIMKAPAPAATEDPQATAKLKELIETMKMDDASLLNKIFPAGAS